MFLFNVLLAGFFVLVSGIMMAKMNKASTNRYAPTTVAKPVKIKVKASVFGHPMTSAWGLLRGPRIP
ncbi:hypothetical protein, partial [Enterobacter asburiae]